MNFGTSNKFAVLQQPVQPRPKGDKLVTSISGPVSNVPKHLQSQESSQNSSEPVKTNNNNRRGGERGGRGGSRGGNRGGRGGNRGGHTDRATLDKLRDPEQPPKRNKRIYDRNSNVPKNDSKKGGAGTGNWGNEKEDPQRGAEDASKEIVGETKADENIIEEVEDKTITLKEYQEQRAALAPKIDAPKRREANEGEKADLKNYVVLKRDEEEGEKLIVKPKKEKAKKKKQQQTVVQLDLLNVNTGSDDRRPRKNFNNNYKQKKVNLSIEDTDSFPALK